MVYISLAATLVGLVLGLVLAFKTPKETTVDRPLDYVTLAFNLIHLTFYFGMTPASILLAMVCRPSESGMLGVVGWIISVIIALTPFFYSFGLGMSVRLRKKGRRVAAFLIQFVGLLALILSFVLYGSTVEVLLIPMN